MLLKVSDMALNKYRLGDLIEIVDEKILIYCIQLNALEEFQLKSFLLKQKLIWMVFL